MKFSSKKIRWLWTAALCFFLSWVVFTIFHEKDSKRAQQEFQQEFLHLEENQSQFKEELKQIIRHRTTQELWKISSLQNSNFIINIYRNDSLVYWNSDHIQLKNRFSVHSTHFLGRFSNGYYLVDHFKLSSLQIFIGTEIKHQFYYQNKSLQNKVVSNFNIANSIKIGWEKEDNFPILSKNGKTLFYLTILPQKSISTFLQFIIFGLFAFGVLALLIAVTLFLRPLAKKKKWSIILYPFFLLALSFSSVYFEWLGLFKDFELFDPGLYASSFLFPNLGSLILHIIPIFIVLWWIIYFLKRPSKARRNENLFLLIGYVALLFYGLFIGFLFQTLIVNSSISLVITEVFSLSFYSFIALLLVASLFLSYYLLLQQLSIRLISSKIRLNKLGLFWFLGSIAFLFYGSWFLQFDIYSLLWPPLINGLFLFFASKSLKINTVRYHLAALLVFSLYSAIILFQKNQLNEHQKRVLYANQLITGHNPTMELEYKTTISKLKSNPKFHRLVGKNPYSLSKLKFKIEDCCFNDFWERYEMSFLFFKEEGKPFIHSIKYPTQSQKEIQSIIQHHSTPSTIASGLYYVNDYYNQLSYIGHQKITVKDSTQLDFYILFKSKKIPEKIGFPRLLMNKKSYALQNLENYSIARYSKGKLVMRFGYFNYPTSLQTISSNKTEQFGFFIDQKMSHYLYHQNGQTIIISEPQKQFIEKVSTFSYLLLFFGGFALFTAFVFRWSSFFPLKYLALSHKVQFVFILMMIGTIIIFAIFATKNVTQQYKKSTKNHLKNKIVGVAKELKEELRKNSVHILSNSFQPHFMNDILQHLAMIFDTDINYYSLKGALVATSQPKLYAKGISAPIMNNKAYFSMYYKKRSEFIHHEHYGELVFLSGYLPLQNYKGEKLGFINVQHFSKQNIFENQMNNFIVTAINLTALLLVISIVLVIVISRWVTSPLRLIQQSFRNVELGKKNQPIGYEGKDEIGALVKDYNDKLLELELKAMQLARSERESAWREMAKQVAHEIKNPLTPMRLTIQQFERSFQSEDPKAKEKIKQIASSLIEQIDSLTKITNEFSNFAKMPKANEENIDLIPIIESTKDLYLSEDTEILLSVDHRKPHIVFADKSLLVRVFNNLIKNAIQARKEKNQLQIKIQLTTQQQNYLITIQDNGQGMTDAIRKKAFIPNFTTKSTGSGLGLAMVKQIISNHNGKIWLETKEGEGTTFYIELPPKKK